MGLVALLDSFPYFHVKNRGFGMKSKSISPFRVFAFAAVLFATAFIMRAPTPAHAGSADIDKDEHGRYSIGVFILDLALEGDLLMDRDSQEIFWDWDKDGFGEHTGWPSGGGAILFLDSDGDSRISGDTELYIARSHNGFAVLSQLDYNKDDVIDEKDVYYPNLLLWQDKNSDTFFQEGEVKSLRDHGIASIDVGGAVRRNLEINKNRIGNTTTFTYENGNEGIALYTRFRYSNEDSKFQRGDVRKIEPKHLPTIDGGPKLPHLRQAMVDDPELFELVRDLVTTPPTNTEKFYYDTFDIMLKWAKVEKVDPESRGRYVDARLLRAVEFFDGKLYRDVYNNTNPRDLQSAGRELKRFWDMHQENVCTFFIWSLGQDYFQILPPMLYEKKTHVAMLGIQLISRQHEPLEEKGAKLFWSTFVKCFDLYNSHVQIAQRNGKKTAYILGNTVRIGRIDITSGAQTLSDILQRMEVAEDLDELRKYKPDLKYRIRQPAVLQ